VLERSRCTHVRRNYQECLLPVPEDSPVTICMKHMREAYTWFSDYLDVLYEQRSEHLEEHREYWRHYYNPRRRDTDPVVYYALVGGLIKIGVTRYLYGRMRGLMAEDLLATEPGDEEVEKARHHQFRHVRVKGREWYEDCPELRAHIAYLNSDD